MRNTLQSSIWIINYRFVVHVSIIYVSNIYFEIVVPLFVLYDLIKHQKLHKAYELNRPFVCISHDILTANQLNFKLNFSDNKLNLEKNKIIVSALQLLVGSIGTNNITKKILANQICSPWVFFLGSMKYTTNVVYFSLQKINCFPT